MDGALIIPFGKKRNRLVVGARHPQSFGISNYITGAVPYKEFIFRQHYLNCYSYN